MIPSVGRIVQYKLNEGDVTAINKRRTDAETSKLARENTGAIVHVGNSVNVGDVYPLVITRVWEAMPTEGTPVNGQVMLDGNDLYWATSRAQGHENGQWFEPVRV